MKDLITDMADSLAHAKALNQAFDQLFGTPKGTRREIDLRGKKFDISVTADPVRGEVFTAVNLETFDPDPESRHCIQGTGKSPNEAVADLFDRLADAETAERIENRRPM